MSSAVTAFVHATLKRSQNVPRAKSGTFWFPTMDSHDSSTIPCYSACVLQYKTGTKFFHSAKLYAVKSINFCYFTIETLNKMRINQ